MSSPRHIDIQKLELTQKETRAASRNVPCMKSWRGVFCNEHQQPNIFCTEQHVHRAQLAKALDGVAAWLHQRSADASLLTTKGTCDGLAAMLEQAAKEEE